MTKAGLMVLWTDVKVGRERIAGELFNSAVAYYTRLVDQGKIESFEPVILARHGGNVNGLILLRGDEAKLAKVRQTDEFQNLTMTATHCLEGFGVVDAVLGQGIADTMARWAKALPG